MTAPRRRSVVTVLVVLAGLLAMHGLAGGHRVDAVSAGAAATAATARADLGHAAHEAISAVPAAPDRLSFGDPAPESGQGHDSGLMILCLAVLVGGLLLLLGQRGRPAPVAAGPRPEVALLPRTARPPRPPDLVAELCVSRT